MRKQPIIVKENVPFTRGNICIRGNKPHKNDFYQTPYVMTQLLCNEGNIPKDAEIFDPCCGQYAIGKILRQNGYTNIIEKDLIYGDDFLECDENKKYEWIIMNPPFYIIDAFIQKAKKVAVNFATIITLDKLCVKERRKLKIWEGASDLLVFDRKINFNDDPSIDNTGMLNSGWLFYTEGWKEDYMRTRVIDSKDIEIVGQPFKLGV